LGPWTFATPEDTIERLEAAGFVDVEAWLQPEPTRLEPGQPLEEFLRTAILGDHLDRLAAAERGPFVRAVAAGLAQPMIDYVRLNFRATRAG